MGIGAPRTNGGVDVEDREPRFDVLAEMEGPILRGRRQETAANHRQVRRSRAEVLSVAEKARRDLVRYGPGRRAKAIHR